MLAYTSTHLRIDIAAHSLRDPGRLVEVGSPLLLWVTSDVGHQLTHMCSKVNAATIIKL